MCTACILWLRFAISSSLNLRKHEIDASSVSADLEFATWIYSIAALGILTQLLNLSRLYILDPSIAVNLSLLCLCNAYGVWFAAQAAVGGYDSHFWGQAKGNWSPTASKQADLFGARASVGTKGACGCNWIVWQYGLWPNMKWCSAAGVLCYAAIWSPWVLMLWDMLHSGSGWKGMAWLNIKKIVVALACPGRQWALWSGTASQAFKDHLKSKLKSNSATQYVPARTN